MIKWGMIHTIWQLPYLAPIHFSLPILFLPQLKRVTKFHNHRPIDCSEQKTPHPSAKNRKPRDRTPAVGKSDTSHTRPIVRWESPRHLESSQDLTSDREKIENCLKMTWGEAASVLPFHRPIKNAANSFILIIKGLEGNTANESTSC